VHQGHGQENHNEQSTRAHLSCPLRKAYQTRPILLSKGRACRVRLLEGPACQVRCATLDYLFRFGGRDRHAPPNLEEPACQVRFSPACQVHCTTLLDHPSRFSGHDKRAPADLFVVCLGMRRKQNWSGGDLNPRPLECDSSALPTELPPRHLLRHKWAMRDSNLRPPACRAGALTN
jgi:hypothetical protein